MASERTSGLGATAGVRYWLTTEAKGNKLGGLKPTVRDTKVSERLDFRSATDSLDSMGHEAAILAKWRTFGKSNDPRMTGG